MLNLRLPRKSQKSRIISRSTPAILPSKRIRKGDQPEASRLPSKMHYQKPSTAHPRPRKPSIPSRFSPRPPSQNHLSPREVEAVEPTTSPSPSRRTTRNPHKPNRRRTRQRAKPRSLPPNWLHRHRSQAVHKRRRTSIRIIITNQIRRLTP